MPTNTNTNNSKTPRILTCACEHPQQDEVHGKGNRVHNYATKANAGAGGYRRSVCSAMKSKTK